MALRICSVDLVGLRPLRLAKVKCGEFYRGVSKSLNWSRFSANQVAFYHRCCQGEDSHAGYLEAEVDTSDARPSLPLPDKTATVPW